jgi:hypothetical protein
MSTKVAINGLGCVNAVDAALTSAGDVNSRCDMENGTITVVASDVILAQKGLEAPALAGFSAQVTQ